MVKVRNVHERRLSTSRSQVGVLIDSLATDGDLLWPKESWPSMRFDRPLGRGASGGHGPIRYFIESYEPGVRVRFRFTGPRGFDGTHGFESLPLSDGSNLLRHTLEMKARGPAAVTWPLVYRPLHNALIEDSLTKAEKSLGQESKTRHWSLWVRVLRRVLRGGRS